MTTPDFTAVSADFVKLLDTHCPFPKDSGEYVVWFAAVRALSNIAVTKMPPPIAEEFAQPICEFLVYLAEKSGMDSERLGHTVNDGVLEVLDLLESVQ